MKTVSIKLDEIPPSNNKFIGRTNRWEYQRCKKMWNLMVRAELKEIPKESFKKAEVHIHYVFPTRTRRDPDNYSGKMLLDPLVTHRVIEDDSFQKIKLVLSAEYQKNVRETHITVKAID